MYLFLLLFFCSSSVLLLVLPNHYVLLLLLLLYKFEDTISDIFPLNFKLKRFKNIATTKMFIRKMYK